jgi:hypothetical protein
MRQDARDIFGIFLESGLKQGFDLIVKAQDLFALFARATLEQ